MNLHEYFEEPAALDYSQELHLLPRNAMTKYEFDESELKKREKMWARDPLTAYKYAFIVLKGRFELGEPAIAKDGHYSYLYALHVLKGPFKLGESKIATNAFDSYFYALAVLQDRFPGGEHIIKTDLMFAGAYEYFINALSEKSADPLNKNIVD